MVVAAPENEGRRVLITGGTGSFGSTVTRGLLAGPIDEIRILSRDEAKQDDMRRRLGDGLCVRAGHAAASVDGTPGRR